MDSVRIRRVATITLRFFLAVEREFGKMINLSRLRDLVRLMKVKGTP
jgi:hypothetical protein